MSLYSGTAEDDPEYLLERANTPPTESDQIFEALPSVAELRHAEYVKPGGADSLYMKWQAGETTEQAWRDERERVRELYPDEEA